MLLLLFIAFAFAFAFTFACSFAFAFAFGNWSLKGLVGFVYFCAFFAFVCAFLLVLVCIVVFGRSGVLSLCIALLCLVLPCRVNGDVLGSMTQRVHPQLILAGLRGFL